ncbi:hypothetical protein HPB50_023497 [Hyalomma asiaticum]|uniref:Uncharacterized protein n=1 Tax=Hyalomma asiaticum TaxID=266040 RepID=A0ACB7S975_HYAAI|nr:hypothetical protein HPB50_023497 [Hyalomma asiaticum]
MIEWACSSSQQEPSSRRHPPPPMASASTPPGLEESRTDSRQPSRPPFFGVVPRYDAYLRLSPPEDVAKASVPGWPSLNPGSSPAA